MVLLSVGHTTVSLAPRTVPGTAQALSMYLMNEQTSVVPSQCKHLLFKNKDFTLFLQQGNKGNLSGPCPQGAYNTGTHHKTKAYVAFLKLSVLF